MSKNVLFRVAAIAELKKRGANDSNRFLAHAWHVAERLDIHIEPDRWIAKCYLDEAAPDIPDVCDQWRAMGSSVQTLADFLDRMGV